MSKPKRPPKSKPLYRRPPPGGSKFKVSRSKFAVSGAAAFDSAPFTLREDGEIIPGVGIGPSQLETLNLKPGTACSSSQSPSSILHPQSPTSSLPRLLFGSDSPFIRLYHGNCLELLDAIAAKYPEGRFDCIFADPPYFLSNGGITCHAGRMVKVDKGDWDKSRGPEWNHEFNTEWLRRCQRVLKPNGTIWITGTHHVIFSIGYALQQLGYKILNDIAWEKPNPPPNLSCRYFTHSTETILWAAKNEKSKHTFNYQEMRKVTGKQMKTVWRKEQFGSSEREFAHAENQSRATRVAANVSSLQSTPSESEDQSRATDVAANVSSLKSNPSESEDQSRLTPAATNIWTLSAPGSDEKAHGKHPTQKPVALIERCLLASTNPGDLVLDPFLGGGTTAVACVRLKRGCVGIELDLAHLTLATRRADRETVIIWLRHFQIRIEISIVGRAGTPLHAASSDENDRRATECAPYPQRQIDLDLFQNLIDRSAPMADKPEVQTERIFHETKFVFLSCAQVSSASVVHTTVDVSLQEAWAKTPNGKRRETTHVVRCETEILKVSR